MNENDVTREVEARTRQYGGIWAENHSRRLVALAARIAGGREHDGRVLRLAAFSHDWGAYDPWKRSGVDHAKRSAEVIPEALGALGVPADVAARVAECALLHHSCGIEAPVEAILLHDADAIDFIGTIGALRCFSTMCRDLRGAAEKTRTRLQYARDHILLAESRALANPRLQGAERLLLELEQETEGLY
jgi:uncharacterized protein